MTKNAASYLNKNPKTLLNLYNVLSLLTLIICITLTVFIYTNNYIKQEKIRANISFQQLDHFFEFQYKSIAEEMWTGNYESILMRVATIAQRYGNAKYTAFLFDTNKNCLASASSTKAFSLNCIFPRDKNQIFTTTHFPVSYHTLSFNNNRNVHIYFTPLSVETSKSGYMYVEIQDPYNFYRGSLLAKLWNTLFPILFLMIGLWLLWPVISKKYILTPYFLALSKSEKNEALGALAAQVAHDIRSPLAVLEMLLQSSNTLCEDKRIFIRNAVTRIKDIANNLLISKNEIIPKENSHPNQSCIFAVTLLDEVITEKRLEFRTMRGIKIEGPHYTQKNYGLFVNVESSNFKRTLSNIINNAIEAIMDKGNVNITLHKNLQDQILISIQDNGIGIPHEILTKLGKSVISHNKAKGHGLGLYHAHHFFSNNGGQLYIESTLNIGTTVNIILPNATPPEWFMPTLTLQNNHIICIIDDDDSIHEIWNKRFSDYQLISKYKLNIHHFFSPQELINWNKNSKFTHVIYLCDYEFTNTQQTGIQLITQLAIENNSILVTSHYEEANIQNLCVLHNIKLMPKNMASFIPIINPVI